MSRRAKEAIKTGLAVVIVYAIAMQMGWDKPYWAAFTVVTINLLSTGVSLSRGVIRSSGTFAGGVAALALVGLFPQERWWYLVSTSLFIGFCAYMLTGKKNQYFWFICALTFLIIVPVSSPLDSQDFFQTAMIRTLETAMGALVYTLVAVFLWPRSSTGMLEDASRKLWSVQAGLYRTYRGLMTGQGRGEDSRPQRMQEVQLSGLLATLLDAAEKDSYEVWEVRHQWRRFRDQSTALMLALERWRASFPEIQELDLKKLLPNLEAVCVELDTRFAQIERMLGGETPEQTVQAVALAVDKAEMRALKHFQEAAVVVTKGHLDTLERLSRSLFDGVRDIKGYGAPAPAREAPRQRGTKIDLDRFRAAFNVVATVWIAFLLWVYVDPPGHALFPMMAAVFALIIAMVPQAGTVLLFLSWGAGAAFAILLNVFVMPHLSGFAELSVMIFAAFFAMYYALGELRQTAARMFCMAAFLILIGIENQQSYDFAQLATSTAWLMLALAVAVAAAYIPPSPRPEKVFLRLQSRFFRRAEFLLSRLALDWDRRKGIAGRWKSDLFRDDLLGLTEKLAASGRQIDVRIVPGHTPDQVQALVASLRAVAFRIKDLVEAREQPQAHRLVDDLIEDLASWRGQVAERFRLRADDPGVAMEPEAELEARLTARLARMEAQIDETLRQADDREFSTPDYANFYRLLGSYRGLVEAAIGYARLADRFDWARWQEARF